MKKHIPNLLTVFRGILVLALIPLFFIPWTYQFHLLYIIFFIASLTDFFDGYLARKWKVVSNFGKMFDPIMDKLLTIILFLLFIPYGILPAWVFALFVVRDIVVDGMKNFMLARNIYTPAIFLGKLKFFCLVLLFHCLFLLSIFPDVLYLQYLLWCSVVIGLIAAYISAGVYLRKFLSLSRTL